MNKKILVIGAGIGQLDAIKRAKDLGYYVLASDGSPNAVGLKVAHVSHIIDVKNVEENLALARQENVNGVISYATDASLPTVLAVRETLGLPGLGRTPMEISLDKSKQRMIFQRANVPQPDFEIVENLVNLKSATKKIGFPIVIKPVDNSGSRGVTLVESGETLSCAYETAMKNSKKKNNNC